MHPDTRDNATFALKARVVDETYNWEGDNPPRTSLASTVIYEVHVKGFSRLNSHLPPALRGLQLGLDWQTIGQMGSLAATYCLEQRGTQLHNYTPAEFVARYREHFDDQGALDVFLPESQELV